MKILLVDNKPSALKLLTRQLVNLGFTDGAYCVRAQDALSQLEEKGTVFGLECFNLQMKWLPAWEARHGALLTNVA